MDSSIYSELGLPSPTNPHKSQEILNRGIFTMINEAALALIEERIVETPEEVDLAMIMGTGFPPFRGGLLRFADSLGSKYIVEQLTKYSETRKALRLKPAPQILQMAQAQSQFYKS